MTPDPEPTDGIGVGARPTEPPRGPVLVTGVARTLGAAYARDLAATGVEVIGVDVTPPQHDLGLASYRRADITSPTIARLVSRSGVVTVVHLALVSGSSGQSRSTAKEINILGAMQLFAACQQASTVRKLVVQSSISVYAASATAPARFTEELSDSHQPTSGLGKDAVEVETYARGLARRRPDCVVTTLRLANLMGAGHQSQIARYLALPVVPRVLGYDARLQFLHPDDAVTALRLVTDTDIPGTYNVAADDVVTLSQALGMMGRPWVDVPRPLLPAMIPAARRAGVLGTSGDELDALTFGRVMDVSRFEAASGFAPQHSSRESLAEFAATAPAGLLSADRVDAGLDAVGSLLSGVARTAGDVRRWAGGGPR